MAGYSCYNEGSIRDWQRHTSQFLAGKSFAGTGGFGPWLVTADEIPDPSRLTLETRLNGQVVQHTTTDLMITPVPELIAYISTILPLLPGDVIVSGTCGGVGWKAQPAALHLRLATSPKWRSAELACSATRSSPRPPEPPPMETCSRRERAIKSITKLTPLGYIGVRSAGLDDYGFVRYSSPRHAKAHCGVSTPPSPLYKGVGSLILAVGPTTAHQSSCRLFSKICGHGSDDGVLDGLLLTVERR